MIKNIKIKNFRSFKELEIDLNNLNVLIGANASGKSNFVHIFQFLRDIVTDGLKNAISLQGGFEYLTNVNLSHSDEFNLKVLSEKVSLVPVIPEGIPNLENKLIALRSYKETYEFSLQSDFKEGFNIIEDNLILEGDFIELIVHAQSDGTIDKITEKAIKPGKIRYTKLSDKITRDVEGFKVKDDDIATMIEKQKGLVKKDTILLENSEYMRIIPPFGSNIFEKIAIYDFDPKLPKRSVPITGKTELEEDGSNLAIVLKTIIDDKDKSEIFSTLMNDILPFINVIKVDKSKEDNSFIMKLKETCSNDFFPAHLISDGTINMTALITALYFEDKPLIIVEEPERNIHPHLISKLVAMVNEASEMKQIIITTHNPEMLKHLPLESLLLISRDSNSFSIISKPHEKKQVKAFLENKIGINSLYARDLLG